VKSQPKIFLYSFSATLEFIEYAIAGAVCWFFKFRILAKQWDLHSHVLQNVFTKLNYALRIKARFISHFQKL